MKKALGGDRLGSGKKMDVELHNWGRSTHDLSRIWRSTMASGTLVPFLSELALPGDSFDINLDCDIKTHPTVGPLFGSYKVQLDVFQAPIRLYQAQLHNNALGIGMEMEKVLLPQIELKVPASANPNIDLNEVQINTSNILHYLGIAGIGNAEPLTPRTFNALPLLSYWDIYKNYYANKQEEIGVVINTPIDRIIDTITSIEFDANELSDDSGTPSAIELTTGDPIEVKYTGELPNLKQVIINNDERAPNTLFLMSNNWIDTGTSLMGLYNGYRDTLTLTYWELQTQPIPADRDLTLEKFDLSQIDDMREALLTQNKATAYKITENSPKPYRFLAQLDENDETANTYSQQGLGIKTYQSDIFNNWLSTEWIDGENGINAITAIDTSEGNFTIDTLNLSKKVYDMLNRIAVSGGSYDDWLDAQYTHNRYTQATSPMYMGGLSKELVFQEVVSNSDTAENPLGTLAGKGAMGKKHKGGHITIKVDEPSYIIGIVSLTPRVDYSQGNKWDIHLKNMSDLHVPALDEIGFQDLITEQLAWWDTNYVAEEWVQKSAGKQPAWLNYMTSINQTHGNFASLGEASEMFMTLNRRYEMNKDVGNLTIKDLTSYIDPVKFNFIFADTALDAQNFWTQIAVDIKARRKISAKLMPNL